MTRTQRMPRNAGRILEMRRAGATLPNGVAVSYVGRTSLMAPHVYCESGERYDWTFLRGMQTYLLVRPGMRARDAIAGLHRVADIVRVGYPILIDVERELMAYIVEGCRFWTVKRESSQWNSVFPLRILQTDQERAA